MRQFSTNQLENQPVFTVKLFLNSFGIAIIIVAFAWLTKMMQLVTFIIFYLFFIQN
jgi:hypothetical protein